MRTDFLKKGFLHINKRLLACTVALLLLACTALSAASCAATEDTLIPEGMQSATAYGATYRLFVPTTWSLKLLPGISGAYYNVSEQSTVSVAEYPMDDALATLADAKARADHYFENALLAEIKLLATGEIHFYEEDSVATLLGDANARQYHCSATVSGDLIHFLHIIAEKEDRMYVFSFTATERLYTLCMSDVQKMLEHFSFGKEYVPQDALKELPADVELPAGMQIASGSEVEYLLFVPSSWKVNLSETVCTANAPDGSSISVVPYLPSGEGISVMEYFEKSEEMMQKTSGGRYTRLSESEITIGGGKALQYEYEYTVGGVTYRYLQVVVGYRNMIYNLTYTALPQNFEANRADVESMIAAFLFR